MSLSWQFLVTTKKFYVKWNSHTFFTNNMEHNSSVLIWWSPRMCRVLYGVTSVQYFQNLIVFKAIKNSWLLLVSKLCCCWSVTWLVSWLLVCWLVGQLTTLSWSRLIMYIGWLVCWLVGQLTSWLVGWLSVDCLVSRLVGHLTGWWILRKSEWLL